MPNSPEPSPLAALIRSLEEQGYTTRAAQAEALGVSLSTWTRRIRMEGLQSQVRHEEWIPWVIARKHHGDLVARYLRLLAQAAAHGPTKTPLKRGSAISWANKMIARGLDISYDRDQGFYYPPAPKDGGHLKRLRDAAVAYVETLAPRSGQG